MKDSSKEAKALLARLMPVKVGDKMEFDGFLKGFKEPVKAHCVETENKDGMTKFWQFSLFWNSVFIQSVVVEHLPGELVIDTLGA